MYDSATKPARRTAFDRLFVSLEAGARHRGILRAGPLRLRCWLGRAGIARRKREGDGATPAGRYRLVRALRRPDRTPRQPCGLPQRDLTRAAGWCDDPASRRYNQPVQLPFRAGHERLWRDDHLYDVVLVLDHNQSPRVRGHGSAIFFHVAGPGDAGTAGCVAIRAADMRRLLPRLSTRTIMVIA